MESGPGTDDDGRDTARRDAGPGSTTTDINIVARVHEKENEMVLDKVRSMKRQRIISMGNDRKMKERMGRTNCGA